MLAVTVVYVMGGRWLETAYACKEARAEVLRCP